ncbi:mCG146111, partial [Mus musculus]
HRGNRWRGLEQWLRTHILNHKWEAERISSKWNFEHLSDALVINPFPPWKRWSLLIYAWTVKFFSS